MIIFIHGDDTVSSRNYFLEERKKDPSSFFFDGETLELTNIIQIIDGGSLFEETKKIFIENLFKKKSTKALDEIISYIFKNEKKLEICLWEGKELSKKQLSIFSQHSVKTFKLTQSLFSFLDSISPRSATLLSLFHKTLESTEPELVFFMILRQVRLLLALSDTKSPETIDEVNRMAPWQKNKLKKQASYFTQEQLKHLYHSLFEIDRALKTGSSSLSLTQSIDILLLEIYH